MRHTLYTNAVYLMGSTFATALFGFLFWVVVTRTFDASTVGLATSLISVSSLIALLGLIGFDTALVRFLPKARSKNRFISTGLIVGGAASALIALGASFLLPLLSSKFTVLHQEWHVVAFVLFTAVATLGALTNAIFLAYKKARYTLLVTIVFSIGKVALPLTFGGGNAMTIFILAGAAQALGFGLSVLALYWKFDFRFTWKIDKQTLRYARRFASSMYAASVLNLLPVAILPLIIVAKASPADAAYYYMCFTIASALYTIAYASMQSAFAEGSHDHTAITEHIIKAARLTLSLILPASIVIILGGNMILAIFGAEYAQGGQELLRIFALSALPVAGYSALGAYFKVTKRLAAAVTMNAAYAIIILGCSLISIPAFGLAAAGWSWLAGNIAACIAGAAFLIHRKLNPGVVIIGAPEAINE